MNDGSRKHICLRTECGICGRGLLDGVSFVPLIGSETSPESILSLHYAVFPKKSRNELAFQGRLLCWLPNCWRCGHSPEAVGIHSDCFNLFKEQCKAKDAIDRLWTATVSRRPWRGAPNLRLGRDPNLAVDLVYEKATIYGISRLRLLPAELIGMVRDYSESGTFWRYISVLSLSNELSEACKSTDAKSPATTIPLCSISAWVRGGEPTFLQPQEFRPIVRLTIDCRGIRQIERLLSRPSYQQWRSDNVAFAIQEERQLEDVTAHLKYNTLQLELPKNILGFHFWDMPNPPGLDDCKFCGRIPQSTRFRTIDLRSATGLTLFFRFGSVYAIHAHTPKMPFATRTFERLSERRQGDMAWAYLPIPKGEEIIAIGVRMRQLEGRSTAQKSCFLVRTKLAGDVSLGPYHSGEHIDMVLSQLHPRLFIYNTPDLGPTTTFGAYPWKKDDSFVPFDSSRSEKAPFHFANLSLAPLKDVTRIQIFDDTKLACCRAILLDYKNGAQRAVGNCRLGVDPVRIYLNPSRICYLGVRYARERPSGLREAVRVESGSDASHVHDDDNSWACSAMEGTLKFWFSEEVSVIKIDVETENQSV